MGFGVGGNFVKKQACFLFEFFKKTKTMYFYSKRKHSEKFLFRDSHEIFGLGNSFKMT